MHFEIYPEAKQEYVPRIGGILPAPQAIGQLSPTAGEWRWRLRGDNGEPIASGESYKNKADCEDAIRLVMSTSEKTPIKYLGK